MRRMNTDENSKTGTLMIQMGRMNKNGLDLSNLAVGSKQ